MAAILAAGLGAAVSPQVVSAQGLEATIKFTDTAVIVETKGPYTNMMLSISGPNEFYTDQFSGREPPAIDLRKIDEYDDGVYRYRVTAASRQVAPIRTALDNGRGDIAKERLVGVSTSGAFIVKDGVIVKHEDIPEEK
ncbi:hypothetical protein D1F64_07075 [Breoghania sp. L-A4]|nr:hypothetical protein D1F64_07075 [Breoghania sp. L-A4]